MNVTPFFSRSGIFKKVFLFENTSTVYAHSAGSGFLSSNTSNRYHAMNVSVAPLFLASYSRTYVGSCSGFVALHTGNSNRKKFQSSNIYGNLQTDEQAELQNPCSACLHTSVSNLPRETPDRLHHVSTSSSCTGGRESTPSIPLVEFDEERNRSEKHAAEEYDKRLRKRIRSAGPRTSVLHRLQDPLTVHLYRVAASHSYRFSRGSVLVTGSTLVKELRKHFCCKRLLIGRRTPMSEVRADSAAASVWPAFPPVKDAVSGPKSSQARAETEIYRASDRVLKKLGGFHSYRDGVLAEMQLPAETRDFGDIKLLLCLGDPCPSQELDGKSKLVDFAKSSNYSRASAVGMYGTLLRSAAALHWQGVWILPKCPDVFSPLGLRASQGALFWMPYRTGSWEDLMQFAAERQLLLCVPHHSGVDAQSPDILGKKAKGLCFIVDSEAQRAAERMVNTQHHEKVSCRNSGSPNGERESVLPEKWNSRGSTKSLETNGSRSSGIAEVGRSLPHNFCPDRLLSVAPPSLAPASSSSAGTVDNSNSTIDNCARSNLIDRRPGSSCICNISTINSVSQEEMKCVHPLTMHTLLMYQLKRAQFPSASASSYVFTAKKKRKSTAQ